MAWYSKEEPEHKKPKDMKSNGEEFRKIDYSGWTEVQMAQKFFDWKFYAPIGNFKRKIKTDADLHSYLHNDLKFSDKTMGEIKHDEQVKWAKKNDMDSLEREFDSYDSGRNPF
jgi:hypothetical protein